MSDNKAGWVYVAESTRPNGDKQIYTGITQRTPEIRWNEHINEVNKPDSKTWTGQGIDFQPIGAVWSNNARKAEQTIKNMATEQKRAFAEKAAKMYYNLE
ncbi:hypothetical protein HK103_004093 [Boothiomyces macroporosus]|uniref:GIY-YIG domain-containing protein n=1 Tax=Boothiomyces macroporosus TaxID=261099 RepID=A0AAD5XZZ4_9FUNG|nr:hypothetical protein HK103_004093 [Boothiomyces macroporosus]